MEQFKVDVDKMYDQLYRENIKRNKINKLKKENELLLDLHNTDELDGLIVEDNSINQKLEKYYTFIKVAGFVLLGVKIASNEIKKIKPDDEIGELKDILVKYVDKLDHDIVTETGKLVEYFTDDKDDDLANALLDLKKDVDFFKIINYRQRNYRKGIKETIDVMTDKKNELDKLESGIDVLFTYCHARFKIFKSYITVGKGEKTNEIYNENVKNLFNYEKEYIKNLINK